MILKLNGTFKSDKDKNKNFIYWNYKSTNNKYSF